VPLNNLSLWTSIGSCPSKFVVFVTFVSTLSTEEYHSTPMLPADNDKLIHIYLLN